MIYPIAEQLEQLMESFVDPETGELIASEEEMQTAIEQLQIDARQSAAKPAATSASKYNWE